MQCCLQRFAKGQASKAVIARCRLSQAEELAQPSTAVDYFRLPKNRIPLRNNSLRSQVASQVFDSQSVSPPAQTRWAPQVCLPSSHLDGSWGQQYLAAKIR